MTRQGAGDPHVAAGLQKWRTKNAAERKAAIIATIIELTNEKGYPPFRKEIADHVEMDLKTVRRYLRELIEEGLVEEPGGVGTRTLAVCRS